MSGTDFVDMSSEYKVQVCGQWRPTFAPLTTLQTYGNMQTPAMHAMKRKYLVSETAHALA